MGFARRQSKKKEKNGSASNLSDHDIKRREVLPKTVSGISGLNRLVPTPKQHLSRWPINADACDHAEGRVRVGLIRRWNPTLLAHWITPNDGPTVTSKSWTA